MPLPPGSTLKAPTAKQLATFRLSGVGDDRVRTFLESGFSLAICCRACGKLAEWTPPDLADRFGSRPELRIIDIARRLTCAGEGGCGSHNIAVFPHLYDQPWRWSPPPSS